MNLPPVTQIEPSSEYYFNDRQLARLAVYRAAVNARFYTDHCETTSARAALDVVRLLDAVRTEEIAA